MSDTVETSPEEGTEEEQAAGEEVVEEIVEEVVEEVAEPPLTRAELAAILKEENQRNYSRQGRRDKELFDQINAKFQAFQKPAEVKDFDFENASQSVKELVSAELSQREQAVKNFHQNVVNEAGYLMETDELFDDKELGDEVVEQFKKEFTKADLTLPPKAAAKILIGDCYKKVMQKRGSKKTTGLDKNKPQKGLKTVDASVKSTKKSFNKDKMSEAAKNFGKNLGLKDADYDRIFKEDD